MNEARLHKAVSEKGPKNCVESATLLQIHRKHSKTLDNWQLLILCVLSEIHLGEKSLWKPFLDILPSSVDTPLYYTKAELNELEGTDTLYNLGCETIIKTYREVIQPIVVEHPNIFGPVSFDEYVRVGALCMSRAFEADPAYHGPVLVPLADMLNHRTGHCNAHLELLENAESVHKCSIVGCKTLLMRAKKDINQNEEIFNTYGDIGNSELLRMYGFVDSVNPFNSVIIPFNCVIGSEETQERLNLLAYKGLIASDGFEIDSTHNEPPKDMMIAAKCLLMTKEQWVKFSKPNKLTTTPAFKIVTPQIIENIIITVQKRLSAYKTSAKEDDTLVKQLEISIGKLPHCSSTTEQNIHNSVIFQHFYSTELPSPSTASSEEALEPKELTARQQKRLYDSVMVRLGEKRILMRFLTKLEAKRAQLSK